MPMGPDERGKLLMDFGEIINLPNEEPVVGDLLDYFTDGMHDEFVEVEVYTRLDYYDGDDELLGWWTFAVEGGEEVEEGTYLVGRLDFCSSQEVYDLVVNVLPGRFALHLCGGKGYCRSSKTHEGLKVWHAVVVERVRYGKKERVKKALPERRAEGGSVAVPAATPKARPPEVRRELRDRPKKRRLRGLSVSLSDSLTLSPCAS
jgi:hypothetical protein